MALPPGFEDMLAAIGGPMARVASALQGETAPAAVRLNALKPSMPPVGAEPVPWCPGGYFLPGRPRFTFDPAMHQGLYYVQDASSMAHAAAVAQACRLAGESTDGEPLRYLDACAAPGGKTIAAVDVLPPDTFVVANEYDRRRAAVLREIVIKHGSGRVTVVNCDASRVAFPDSFFDIIAADVPCSGEGMMRKEAAAIEQWSPSLVSECASLQRRIIDNLWTALRPGGLLIYSTCTFNLEENERVVAHITDELGGEAIDIPQLNGHGIVGAQGGYSFAAYRFLPGQVRGEGQFIALLRKPGDAPHTRVKKTRDTRRPSPHLDSRWGMRDEVMAARSIHMPLIDVVERAAGSLYYYGVETGTQRGRDFIPSQSLAMAVDTRHELYPTCEVDEATALEYLRHHPVVLDAAPRGIVLLKHGGYPLGYVKNLGSRANNLYPSPWRILN